MDWTELLACKSRSQQEEALTKQISCALSPVIGRWLSWPLMFARRGLIAIADIARHERALANEARSAKRFCDEWGVELISVYGDRRSGFELLACKWGDRGELVFVGSDDALDWWHNLTDKAIGLPPFNGANPDRDDVTHYFRRGDLIPPLPVRKTKGWFVPGKKIIWKPGIRYHHALRIEAHRMLLSTQSRP